MISRRRDPSPRNEFSLNRGKNRRLRYLSEKGKQQQLMRRVGVSFCSRSAFAAPSVTRVSRFDCGLPDKRWYRGLARFEITPPSRPTVFSSLAFLRAPAPRRSYIIMARVITFTIRSARAAGSSANRRPGKMFPARAETQRDPRENA